MSYKSEFSTKTRTSKYDTNSNFSRHLMDYNENYKNDSYYNNYNHFNNDYESGRQTSYEGGKEYSRHKKLKHTDSNEITKLRTQIEQISNELEEINKKKNIIKCNMSKGNINENDSRNLSIFEKKSITLKNSLETSKSELQILIKKQEDIKKIPQTIEKLQFVISDKKSKLQLFKSREKNGKLSKSEIKQKDDLVREISEVSSEITKLTTKHKVNKLESKYTKIIDEEILKFKSVYKLQKYNNDEIYFLYCYHYISVKGELDYKMYVKHNSRFLDLKEKYKNTPLENTKLQPKQILYGVNDNEIDEDEW